MNTPEHTGIHDSLIRVVFVFLPGTEMLTINNFLFKAQIDNINLFKVDDSVTILIKKKYHSKLHKLSEPFNVPLTSVTEILWEEHDQQKSKC